MEQALGEGNFYWNLGQALDVNAKDGVLTKQFTTKHKEQKT
jgi:hypothetical protein